MTKNEFDLVGFIIDFEGGMASDEEVVEGFQYIINNNLAGQLQGFYGRTARALIDKGFCKPANEWSPREARENFLSYMT